LGFIWTALTFAVASLLLLTIVVFIHELGHFLVARWCGVKVQTFSIGFGQEIFGFNDRHGTRWCFARWPLGGYVKFVDDENAASAPSRAALETMDKEARAGAFQTKPLWQRAAVVIAGPLFNIVSAAIILFLWVWLVGAYLATATIGAVVPKSAADNGGLQPGDRIVAIDGQKIEWFTDLQRIVFPSPGKPLKFTVDRQGAPVELTITPSTVKEKGPLGTDIEKGLLGVKPGDGVYRRMGFGEAVSHGIRETGNLCAEVVKGLPNIPTAIVKVFSFKPQNDIGGPAAIVQMTGQAAQNGIGSFVRWLAIFSVILGIMNLLPIPLLDGGHLMFYALEAIRGKPLDERMQEIGFKIGIAIIVTMMSAAFLGDVTRLFGLAFGSG